MKANIELAEDIARQYGAGTIDKTVYDAVMQMAEQKDALFEQVLTDIIIIAQQGYTQCAPDEAIKRNILNFLRDATLQNLVYRPR